MMRHVIPIEGPNLVGISVEPVHSAVRVTLDYRDDHVLAMLLTPIEAARLAVALQAAAWHHIGGKSGEESP
jgi:hypothetical protein